jgi:hypothetical protein
MKVNTNDKGYEWIRELPPALQEEALNWPGIPPPNGTVSQFVNPPNGNTLGRVVAILCLVIATLAVCLRAYARVVILRKVHVEDFLALSGYALFVAFVYCIFSIIGASGLFVHQWDIRIKDMAEMIWFIHLSANFYAISVMTLKAAILLEWTRLFAPYGISPWFSRTAYILLTINVIFYSSGVIASASSCRPYKRIWDRTVPGKCINTFILDMASSGINVSLDIAILLLPQKLIWRLQMTMKRKIGTSIIFGIGVLATISGIYRLVATLQYITSDDTTYTISAVGSGCLFEMLCTILVFCTPTFPAIVRGNKWLKGIASSLLSWIPTFSARSGSRWVSFESKAIRLGNVDSGGSANQLPGSRPQQEG